MAFPQVSAIIPTYNRKRYVQLAIDSALTQTYPNLEVIVVDDGSTDGTEAALAGYAEKIRYIKQENQGESVARNVGIYASQGEYIALLDSDDLWKPDKVERQLEFLQNNPDIGLVSCHVGVINEHGTVVTGGPVHPEQKSDRVSLENLVLDSPVHASTILLHRQSLDDVGVFDTTIRYGEDWDLCLRLASKYQIGFILGEPLTMLRTHGEAQSRYLVPKSEARRRLADWDCVIHKNFAATQNNSQAPNSLEAVALAQSRARIALLDYVYKDYVSGQAHLRQVIQLAPAKWADGTRISEMIHLHAMALAQKAPGRDPIDFVEAMFNHLPTEIVEWRSRYRREILGRLHIELAFFYFSRSMYRLVPRMVLTGFYYDPRSITNLGIFSILIRSLRLRVNDR
jgi:glycosyltransferase involved in cell wall biosynthesis